MKNLKMIRVALLSAIFFTPLSISASSSLYTVNNFSAFTALTLSIDNWRIAPSNSFPTTHVSTPLAGSKPFGSGRMGVISNSAGVSLGSNFKFPLGPGSNTGVVDVVAKVPKASLAKAITNFAKKVSPLSTAVAVYDLFKEIGVSIKHGEGENTFYRNEINSGYLCHIGDKTSLTCLDAFNQYWDAARRYAQYGTTMNIENIRCPSSPSDGNVCFFESLSDFTWVGGPGDWRRNYHQQPVIWITSETPNETPVTREEVERLLGTPESWPPSSAIPGALGEALGSGETVQVETPKVTVPPSQPGLLPTSETVKQTSQETYTRPDGSTGTREIVKTVTTTRNPSLSSNQDLVRLTNRISTTTTTQVHNDDGTVTNSPPVTTTTESTNTTDYPQDYDPSDSSNQGSSNSSGQNICQTNPNSLACQNVDPDIPDPAFTVPVLYTPKYPGGLSQVWNSKVGELKSSSLYSLMSGLSPDLGDSRGCPVWMLEVNLGKWNFGSFNVSPPCFVWSFIRLCVIVSALFLARALIFGG